MAAQCTPSILTILVLLGLARAGPFSPRSNVTLPAPRPPPKPGGPSSQLYEHTVEGGEKQVVFTHRINLPPSAGCGCPPGSEPPVPASEVQALRVRLEILEELVKGLKEHCTGGCCPTAAQAGTGQTDVRSLCSLHGVFDLSRCACSCEPGWGGPTCSDPTDTKTPTSSPPSKSCPEDCNDQGRCVRGRCVCFPGYSGPSCSWPSCPGDCQGRGRCVKGVCVCRAGFSGPDCSQRSCPRNCNQRGRCEEGRCVCDPGYSGEDCGVRSCPRGCSQRGRCENGLCVCNPGYSGEDCGVRNCPRGCSQRGRCEDGRCVCDPGYSGEDCSMRTCPWDCGDGGRCVDGRCVCWPGYSGEDCSTRTCPRDCRGRGRCEDGECICDAGYSGDDCGVRSCPGDCNQRGHCEDGRCVCWPGYTGADCSTRACPRDCRGRGRCEDGVCVCHAGYSGEDCGVRSCPGDCRGRGNCESGRCVCWPGYTGRDCGTRACPGDCRGRGRCVDGRCVCNPGFTGEDCGSRRCPGDCRGHGHCENGVCVCAVGYSGDDCSTRSCPSDCRGRGQCLNGLCECDEGYSGEDCGIRRCPRDCSQHGVCQDGLCMCHAGYAGEDCSIRTCPADCRRRGRCEDGRCVCNPGYTGPACATRTCPADCRGRGRCVQGVCMCYVGYSGEDCGQEEPPASACPGGCGPRELCRAGQCVCVEGFRGPDCAIQTCPGDCRSRGECIQGRCVCQEGYAGDDCGEEIPAIQNMRMHLLEETTVRTEWTRAPGPVDAYEIQFIPMTEGVSPPFTARVPSSASAYDQRGLAPGQDYQVTVRALRGTSWGPPASKTITTMIDGPQDLRVVAVTPTTLDLSWLRPQAEVDRFVVSYVSAGNQRVRLEVPPEADRTQLTDLMPGVEYVVTVTAERGHAVSYPASIRANTDRAQEQPGKPSVQPRLGELTVTGLTSDSLLLHWTVPEGEFDSFLIQYKDKDGPQAISVEGPQRSTPISGLEPGRKYKFILYGLIGKKRHGPLMAEAKILIQSDPDPGSPPRLGELWVTDPTPHSLHLSWTVLGGQFDSFVVQYRDKEGQPRVVPVEGPDRSVVISPLDPNRKYRFTLFGIANKKRYGPLTADGTTAAETKEESSEPPRLGELTVTGVTPDSLRLSWTVARGPFDSFVILYKDAQGQPQSVPIEGDENEVTVPGLESNRKYKMNLYGLRGRQRVGPVSVVAKTAPPDVVDQPLSPPEPSTEAPEPPEKPLLRELIVTDTTPNSLSLSWTVSEGQFDQFVIQYKNGDGQPKVVRVPGHEDQVTISGLEPDHKYKMNLYGIHSGQRVGPVSVVGVTAAEEEPPSPTEPSTEAPEPTEEPLLGELTVTGSSPDSLSLSWTVPQGDFDSFTVQYKSSDGRPQVMRVGGQEREVIVRDLDPGHKYKMNLYGLHEGHRVGPVSTVGTTDKQPEEKPPLEPRLEELTVTGVTPNSVSLSWIVPEGQFDSFVVQYQDRDGQPREVPLTAEQREVTVLDLDPARIYKMNFYGLHGRRRVGPLSVSAMTAPAPATEASKLLPEPRLGELTVTDVTPDSVGLLWTVPEGEFDSFTVQYKDRDGQPHVVSVAADLREVTIPGLEPSRKYKFLLFGVQDGKRRSQVSVEAKTATHDDTSPGAPPRLGELWVTDPTTDSLRLSWTVPEGHFDSFVVQFKDKSGPRVVPVKGQERTATITALDAGRKYRFLLYGLLGRKRFGPLTAEGITEPTNAADHTKSRLGEELRVTGVTQNSVDLSWTVSEGQFDSFVVQYKDRDGQSQVVPVDGSHREVRVSGLDPGRRYKLLLYGLRDSKRVGPLSVIAVTDPRETTEAWTEVPTTSTPAAVPRLGELRVEEATPHSLHLSWVVTEGEFNSFEVQYTDRDGQLRVASTEGDQTDITLTGLESNHRYLITLYGFHDGQPVGSAQIEALTVPWEEEEEEEESTEPPTMTPEPRPQLGELTVTDATPDSLSLSWTVPEGQFDQFVIQYKNGDGQPKVVRVPGHEDQVTISGLEPDHKYKLNLYGIHSGQRFGPVSTVGVTAAVEEPPSPTEPSIEAPEPTEEPLLGELTVTGSSPDSLSLSWTVPQGDFDSFTVQYKDSDGRPQVMRVGGQEREVIVRDLDPGRKYKMNLYGLHEGRRVGPVSTVGVTASLTTEPPIEPRLGELAAVEVTSSTVHLSWTVAQGPFDSFLVQYKDTQGQPQMVPVSGDLGEVTVSGLEPARKYKFLLFGLKDGKRHGPVSTEAKTVSDAKLLPRLGELTVTDTTQNSVGLSWTVPEGEFDSFLVQYKNRGGQVQVVPAAADQREVTISSLEPNRKYRFLLFGLIGLKRLGPVSVEGTTAPVEKTPQPRLGELSVTEETSDSMHLSWSVAQGPFDSFLVQYKDRDGQLQTVSLAADQREVTIEGLQPGRKYKFLLYGLTGGKRLGPISALGVTASEVDISAPDHTEPPHAPGLGTLAVTEATPDSLRLSWAVARGPFDSFVVQYQDTENETQALLVDGDQDKVLISGLEPKTSYKFFLYGLREGTRHGPVSVEGTTDPVPAGQGPGDPGPRLSQLSVSDVTTSSLRLNWEAPLGAFDSFLLRFGVPLLSTLEQNPRTLQQRELMVPGVRRSAMLRDLRPGTLYSLTLYGLRGPHKADSIQGTARTLSPVLESPRDLQFSDIGETSAKVKWVPPTSRVDSFKISYQLADGGEPQSVQVDGRTQTQILQGLIPDTRYEVTVVSVRGFEESEPLTGFLTTVPDGPTQLRALNLTDGSALLHWKPPHKPVDKYDVEVESPGAPPLQASAPGSAVDYPLTDLALDTNYTATVRGLRGPNFTSPASITFTTGLKPPQDLEAKEVTPRTALLTWTEPEVPPTGYLLSFDTPGGQIQEILLPAGTTSHRLLRLFPSTFYSAQLRAIWGESLTPPVLTSFTTGGLRIPFPRDCGEELKNGPSASKTTTIFLNGNRERPLDVFCDMETDGGGWLVFQRRMDGQTDFWRDWEEYAHGFGNISGEFWLGNEALHSLTQAGDYSLRVDLRAGKEAVFAQYDFFRVDSAKENYRLHLEGYHGTAGDSMSYHSGSVFSARDRDPNNLLISCAVSYRGAWWYRNCHYANLNGLYGSTVDHQGVSWYHWKGFEFSVPFTEMKLRPRNFQVPTRGT
ncbi:tenascin-X precursor [Mus musculus]|uniref:Tenascin XB n=1 Tax=Mus musculus TaxID=10090 RepID=E9Q2T3_MOUSE|nr:tenascin-X precursor [Mus musculus]|eukprot:NP_112453.2 tenascin-X precursor [Mus musculus]